MAISQINIRNITSRPLPVQAVFARDRQFSQILTPGQTVNISAMADVGEVNRSADIQALVAAGALTVSYVPGLDIIAGVPGIEDAYGRATGVVMRIPFAAAAGDVADDVTVYSSNSPRLRILKSSVIVLTAVGASTVTLRTAISGGGTALSDAWVTTSTGTKDTTALTAPATLAAGSSLYIARNHNGVAGQVILLLDNS